MLVLSRKINQGIKVGDDVEIYIKRVRGKRVTIGVKAPDSVRVSRVELPPLPDKEGENES